MLLLTKSHKILSNIVLIFELFFSNFKLLGKKKIHKIRRSVSLQNKPRTNLFSIPSTLILGNGHWDLETRASRQITSQYLQIWSISGSLVLMQIFNYLILNHRSAKKVKQPPQQVLSEVTLKYILYSRAVTRDLLNM